MECNGICDMYTIGSGVFPTRKYHLTFVAFSWGFIVFFHSE